MKSRLKKTLLTMTALSVVLLCGCTGEKETSKLLRSNARRFTNKRLKIRIAPQPGDFICRRGMPALVNTIEEEFTHGAIYLGNGLTLDYWHKGRRIMTMRSFYLLASNGRYQAVMRFEGPYRNEIIAQLLANIDREDVRRSKTLDPVQGFNLLSTADNYKTSVCNEFLHAQYKYAIRLVTEKAKKNGNLEKFDELKREYFDKNDVVKSLVVPIVAKKEMSPRKFKFIKFLIKVYGGGKAFEGEVIDINKKSKKSYQLRCITPKSFEMPGSRFRCVGKYIPPKVGIKPSERFNRFPSKKRPNDE